MIIKVELHTHTNYSNDSLLFKWWYLIILKLKGINVVGITDHNEIIGAKIFREFLGKFGIRVIVGEEISTSKGEIIGLFLEKKIPSGLTPRETMLEIKKQGGLVYIPHPYDEKRYKTVLVEEEIKKNCDLIDIIEVYNGRNIESYYADKQLEIGQKYNKIKCVGSDAHTFIELGRNYNIMQDFDTPQRFLDNLKYAEFIKKKCILLAHHITKIDKLLHLFRKRRFCEIYRIINKRYTKRSE